MNHLLAAALLAISLLTPTTSYSQQQGGGAQVQQRAKSRPQGFLDYALGKVNPNDYDYGETAAALREGVVGHTIDDLYFWSNLVSLTLLVVVTTSHLFHLRAAAKREVIAASLLTQLWNGRVSDGREIERRTQQYNALVEVKNTEVERSLGSPPAAGEDHCRDASDGTPANRRQVDQSLKALKVEQGTSSKLRPVPPSVTANAVPSDLGWEQRAMLFERQNQALRNTEQNLKERLNQVTFELDQERRRNQTLKGA